MPYAIFEFAISIARIVAALIVYVGLSACILLLPVAFILGTKNKQTPAFNFVRQAVIPLVQLAFVGFLPFLCFYILFGTVVTALVWPIFACLLVTGLISSAVNGVLEFGSSNGTAKYKLHKAALISDPAATTQSRLTRIGSYQFLALFLLLLIPSLVYQANFISYEAYWSISILILFSVVPCASVCSELMLIQNRLLWETNVDDGLRLKSILSTAPRLVLPILSGYVVSVFLQPHLPSEVLHTYVFSLFIFLSSVLVVSLIQLYLGSSGFHNSQDEYREKKRRRLRRIGDLGLITNSTQQNADRMRFAAHLIFELRNSISSDVILRVVFAEYFFEAVATYELTDDEAIRIGKYLFGFDDPETSKHIEIMNQARNSIGGPPGSEMSVANDELESVYATEPQLEALFADILVPFGQATAFQSEQLTTLIKKHLDPIRGWDLRFWYGFDLIDYIIILVKPEINIAAFAVNRAHDVEIMSRPEYIGKTLLTVVYSLIIFLAGKFQLSETMAQWAKSLVFD
jgi:hypothetical protein